MDLRATGEVHVQPYGSRGRIGAPPEVRDPALLHAWTHTSVGYWGAVRLRNGKLITCRDGQVQHHQPYSTPPSLLPGRPARLAPCRGDRRQGEIPPRRTPQQAGFVRRASLRVLLPSGHEPPTESDRGSVEASPMNVPAPPVLPETRRHGQGGRTHLRGLAGGNETLHRLCAVTQGGQFRSASGVGVQVGEATRPRRRHRPRPTRRRSRRAMGIHHYPRS